MTEDKRAKFGVKRIKITVFNQGGVVFTSPQPSNDHQKAQPE